MYMLLGDILEKLENDRYEAMIASKLFEPIGMVSTKVSSSYVDVITGNVAKPIIAKEKGGEFEEGNYEIYRSVFCLPSVKTTNSQKASL